MEASDRLFQILRSLVQQLPSLLAMLGCIVAAIVLWSRHPKVSLTVIIGMALLIVHAFVFVMVYALVPSLFIRSSSYEHLQAVYHVISFLYNSTLAVGLGVLLAAIFMQRSQPA